MIGLEAQTFEPLPVSLCHGRVKVREHQGQEYRRRAWADFFFGFVVQKSVQYFFVLFDKARGSVKVDLLGQLYSAQVQFDLMSIGIRKSENAPVVIGAEASNKLEKDSPLVLAYRIIDSRLPVL